MHRPSTTSVESQSFCEDAYDLRSRSGGTISRASNLRLRAQFCSTIVLRLSAAAAAFIGVCWEDRVGPSHGLWRGSRDHGRNARNSWPDPSLPRHHPTDRLDPCALRAWLLARVIYEAETSGKSWRSSAHPCGFGDSAFVKRKR